MRWRELIIIQREHGSLVIFSLRILFCDASGSHFWAIDITKLPADWVLQQWNKICSRLAIGAGAGQNLQSGDCVGLFWCSLPLEGRGL